VTRLWYYIFIFANFGALAQGFRSRIYLPGSLDHSTKAIFQAPGNKYLGAGFSVDVVEGKQVCRLTVMGLDSAGKLEWVKKYGDTSLLYYTNNFISRVFYNHGGFVYYAGCATDSTQKQIGVFAKINFSGDTLWQKIFRDADSLEGVVPQMVTASRDGGFLITGFFQSWGSNGQRLLLIKTDVNGNELWRKKISKVSPNVQDGKSIIQDSTTKKIVIAGYQYNFGNNSIDNILVLDSLGNELQRTAYISGFPRDMIQTRNGKMLVAGSSVSVKNSFMMYQGYAAKFDLNNPFPCIWTKIRNEQNCNNGYTALKEFPNSDVMLAQWRDSFLVNQNHEVSFLRIDSNGQVKWNKQYDYQMEAGVIDFELTKDEGWVAAMDVGSQQSVNPFFFVRYDSTGCDTTVAYCSLASALSENEGGQFWIFPIPCNDKLTVRNTTGNIRVQLFDCTGSLQMMSILDISIEQLEISTVELPAGVYLLRLDSGNAVVQRNVIIEH
jgi:hypothetical protein